jgi:hypothetical protein
VVVVSVDRFTTEPGYLIIRQDGLRVRFDGEHNEVVRVTGDPTPAAAAMPPMGGLAGAVAPQDPVQLPLQQPAAVQQAAPVAGGGLAAAVAQPQASTDVVQMPEQQVAVTPEAPEGVDAGADLAATTAHTLAAAITSLKKAGMSKEEVINYIQTNHARMACKATINVATLGNMVPAIYQFAS